MSIHTTSSITPTSHEDRRPPAAKPRIHQRKRRVTRAIAGLVLAGTTSVAAFAGATQPAGAASIGSSLRAGVAMTSGQSLSAGGRSLVMQSDGNLVGRAADGSAPFSTRTSGHAGAYAVIEKGALHVDYKGTVLWSSHTSTATSLRLESSGRLSLRRSTGQIAWETFVLTAPSLATMILNNPNVTGPLRNVVDDLQRTASGRPTSDGRYLSRTLLNIVAVISDGHQLSISSITGAGSGHSTNPLDPHYFGHAADLYRYNGNDINGRDAGSNEIIKRTRWLMPPLTTSVWTEKSAYGQKYCGTLPVPLPSGVYEIGDSCTHLHLQVNVNAG